MRARVIVGLVGTLAAFALALWLIDWHALLTAFARLSPGVILVSSIFSIATTLILAARWAMLAAATTHRGTMQSFLDALVGQVFNLVTPAAVGADAYRAVVASGRDGGRTRAVAMLFLERAMGLWTYALAFLVAFAIEARERPDAIMDGAAVVFAAILLMLSGMVLVARHSIWASILPDVRGLRNLRDAVGQIRNLSAARLLSAVALTVVGLATWLLCLGIMARGTGLLLPARVMVMIAVVTECARLLPISAQGIGVREVTFATLATQAGGDGAAAFAACATGYALHFLLAGLIGITARTFFYNTHLRFTG
jgi:uncharacterized membrane protein YbhN (UPF0104 family)